MVKVRFSLKNTFRFKVKDKFTVSEIQFSLIKPELFRIDLFNFGY